MKCTNCGTELKLGQKFCPRCGTKAEEKEQRTCPKCGQPVKEGLRFCTNCGEDLEKKVEFNTCPNCGENVPKEQAFCQKCGSKMEELPTVEPTIPEDIVLSANDRVSEDEIIEEVVEDVLPTPEIVRTCPKCGQPVKEGLKYCISCGHDMDTPVNPIPAAPTMDTVVCPHCGSSVKAGLKFCTSCGKSLVEEKSQPKEKKKGKGKVALIVILVLLLLAGAAGGGYYFFSFKANSNSLVNYVTGLENEQNYSEKILINHIMEEQGVSREKAEKAIKDANVDFNEVAVNKVLAENNESKVFSKQSMKETLMTNYQFTEQQAQYGVDNAKVDYVENARKKALELAKNSDSKKTITNILVNDYKYTSSEAEDGINKANIDFKDACYQKGKTIKEVKEKDDVKKSLSEYGFTDAEVEYAMDKLYTETDTIQVNAKYRTNYDMNVRNNRSVNSKQVGYLVKGSEITVYETAVGTDDASSTWARIGDNQWVCVRDSKYSAYISKIG